VLHFGDSGNHNLCRTQMVCNTRCLAACLAGLNPVMSAKTKGMAQLSQSLTPQTAAAAVLNKNLCERQQRVVTERCLVNGIASQHVLRPLSLSTLQQRRGPTSIQQFFQPSPLSTLPMSHGLHLIYPVRKLQHCSQLLCRFTPSCRAWPACQQAWPEGPWLPPCRS